MRARFELQMSIGQRPISEIPINPKSKNPLEQLIAALKEIFCNTEYNEKIFSIMEKYMPQVDKNNGRPGMNLWTIFVLSQVRLCLDLSYDMLHNYSNNHLQLRQLLGICDLLGHEEIIFEYQNIYDNLSKLSDAMLIELNDIIVEFGHKEVFKKKGTTPLHLKTDSFVVESNVHFPTDYNLLWDSMRKSLFTILYFRRKYPQIDGWRKIKNWSSELKSQMREIGRISKSGGKNKEKKLKELVEQYLIKSRLLLSKLENQKISLPIKTETDLKKYYNLEYYIEMIIKHIDLLERRVLKGEVIPHKEKIMSIFEPYTEFIIKGKSKPPVELGKMFCITTDQYNLILLHKVMHHQKDKEMVIEIADAMLHKYQRIESMSFDKGYWSKENKDLLELEIPQVILPKLGKRTKEEEEKEKSQSFKRLKNKHSAIESNINELEHRGLNRCPDRSYSHFTTYLALGVCAYNLKKIGKKILEERHKEQFYKKVA
jgi:hypothetical protein